MDNVKNNFEELKNLLLSAVGLMENITGELEERVLVVEKKLLDMEKRIMEYESVGKSGSIDDILAAGGVVSAADTVVEFEPGQGDAVFEESQTADFTVPMERESVETNGDATADTTTDGTTDTIKDAAAMEDAAVIIPEMEMTFEETENGLAATSLSAIIQEEPATDTETIEVITEKLMTDTEIIEEEQTAVADVEGEDGLSEIATDCELGGYEVEKINFDTVEKEDDTPMAKDLAGTVSVNDAAKPDWYDWEVDYPAAYIDDIYKGISFNDRYEFVKELFNVTGNLSEAEIIFKETLDDINGMDSFKEVVAYIRHRFPQWDELSDEVYRFYMVVRRKFNN